MRVVQKIKEGNKVLGYKLDTGKFCTKEDIHNLVRQGKIVNAKTQVYDGSIIVRVDGNVTEINRKGMKEDRSGNREKISKDKVNKKVQKKERTTCKLIKIEIHAEEYVSNRIMTYEITFRGKDSYRDFLKIREEVGEDSLKDDKEMVKRKLNGSWGVHAARVKDKDGSIVKIADGKKITVVADERVRVEYHNPFSNALFGFDLLKSDGYTVPEEHKDRNIAESNAYVTPERITKYLKSLNKI